MIAESKEWQGGKHTDLNHISKNTPLFLEHLKKVTRWFLDLKFDHYDFKLKVSSEAPETKVIVIGDYWLKETEYRQLLVSVKLMKATLKDMEKLEINYICGLTVEEGKHSMSDYYEAHYHFTGKTNSNGDN